MSGRTITVGLSCRVGTTTSARRRAQEDPTAFCMVKVFVDEFRSTGFHCCLSHRIKPFFSRQRIEAEKRQTQSGFTSLCFVLQSHLDAAKSIAHSSLTTLQNRAGKVTVILFLENAFDLKRWLKQTASSPEMAQFFNGCRASQYLRAQRTSTTFSFSKV